MSNHDHNHETQWKWYDCGSNWWNTCELCVYCTEMLPENSDFYVRVYCVKEEQGEEEESGQVGAMVAGQTRTTQKIIMLYDSSQHMTTAHIPKCIETESGCSEHV